MQSYYVCEYATSTDIIKRNSFSTIYMTANNKILLLYAETCRKTGCELALCPFVYQVG